MAEPQLWLQSEGAERLGVRDGWELLACCSPTRMVEENDEGLRWVRALANQDALSSDLSWLMQLNGTG